MAYLSRQARAILGKTSESPLALMVSKWRLIRVG
jgi:hypothetical protein